MHRPKFYSYALAVIGGIAIFGAFINELTIPFAFAVFLAIGTLFGWLWPSVSVIWGLWLVAPVLALTGLSVLFVGGFDSFLRYDAPPILAAFSGGCLGGYLGSVIRKRSKK
jgi:hypothetical protein